MDNGISFTLVHLIVEVGDLGTLIGGSGAVFLKHVVERSQGRRITVILGLPVIRLALADNEEAVKLTIDVYHGTGVLTLTATQSCGNELNGLNVPCEIVDVMESPDYNNSELQKLIYPVSITMNNIKGKIIPPGEKYELKIVVYYNVRDNVVSTPKEFTYKIGLITKSR